MRSADGRWNSGPLNGFQGMRFTFAGMPRSRRGRRSASASLSLTPASSTYSKVTRRPCDSGNRRAASSSAAIGHFLLIGMIRVADLVGGRVQRDREVGRRLQRAELVDAGHQAGRRHRQPARREARAPRVLEQRERARDVVEVVQRLAHPHEHQVGGAAARQRGRLVDLRRRSRRRPGGARSRASRSRRTGSRSRSRPATRCTGSACCGRRPRRESAPLRWRGRRACGTAACACRRAPSAPGPAPAGPARGRVRGRRAARPERWTSLRAWRRPDHAASGRSARRGTWGRQPSRPSWSARQAAARADRASRRARGGKRRSRRGRIHHASPAGARAV